jgi:MFS family permease
LRSYLRTDAFMVAFRPFLREVHGLSPIEAGNVLFLAVIAYQVGMLAFGPLDRLLNTRKWIAIGGSLAIISLLAALALVSHSPIWVPIAAILGIGFFSASATMVMTHARGIFPDRLIGRGMATINTSVMLGVACMQHFPPSSLVLSNWPTARALKPHTVPFSVSSPRCSSSPSRSTAARRMSSPVTKCVICNSAMLTDDNVLAEP